MIFLLEQAFIILNVEFLLDKKCKKKIYIINIKKNQKKVYQF